MHAISPPTLLHCSHSQPPHRAGRPRGSNPATIQQPRRHRIRSIRPHHHLFVGYYAYAIHHIPDGGRRHRHRRRATAGSSSTPTTITLQPGGLHGGPAGPRRRLHGTTGPRRLCLGLLLPSPRPADGWGAAAASAAAARRPPGIRGRGRHSSASNAPVALAPRQGAALWPGLCGPAPLPPAGRAARHSGACLALDEPHSLFSTSRV